MGPKLINCCRPEQMDTEELGKLRKGPTQRGKELETRGRKELRERSIRGCQTSLKWKA